MTMTSKKSSLRSSPLEILLNHKSLDDIEKINTTIHGKLCWLEKCLSSKGNIFVPNKVLVSIVKDILTIEDVPKYVSKYNLNTKTFEKWLYYDQYYLDARFASLKYLRGIIQFSNNFLYRYINNKEYSKIKVFFIINDPKYIEYFDKVNTEIVKVFLLQRFRGWERFPSYVYNIQGKNLPQLLEMIHERCGELGTRQFICIVQKKIDWNKLLRSLNDHTNLNLDFIDPYPYTSNFKVALKTTYFVNFSIQL